MAPQDFDRRDDPDGTVLPGARDGWLWVREFLKLLEQVEREPAGAAQQIVAAAGGRM